MNKKKFNNQLIILGSIIVVLLAVLLFQSKDKMHYDIPTLEKIPQDQVTKIEIVKKEGTVLLEKKGENWMISPQQYPTDSNTIDSILKTISGLNLTDMASESQNYALYGLAQNEIISVNVSGNGDIVRSFGIGNVASTNSHTFVRIKNDSNVYLASGNFRRDFEKKVDEFRDKIVMKFDKNEIQEISITKGKESFHAVKKVQPPKSIEKKVEGEEQTPPEEVIQWVMDDGQIANENELDSMLNQLQSVSCANYIEGKGKEDFSKPIYQITLKGAKEYTVALYDKTGDDDKKYPAISSENDYPFMFSSYIGENIMKKIEDLKKKKE